MLNLQQYDNAPFVIGTKCHECTTGPNLRMSSHQTSAISDLAKVFKGDVHAQALLYPHKRTKEQTPLSLFKFFRRKVSLFCIPFASQAYLPTYLPV